MPTNRLDDFLRAEETASRLVEDLARLKQEIESYRTAHQALDQAAEGVGKSAAQMADLAGQMGGDCENPSFDRHARAVSGTESTL